MTNLHDIPHALKALFDEPQRNRFLKMSFPREDGPSALLLPNSLTAQEGLSRDFHYEVELLSDNAHIALKDLQGKMVTLELLRNDRSPRYFNGYVFEFRFVKSDNGHAYYRMVLKPWLAYLQMRRDSHVFRDTGVLAQTEEVLRDYATVADWRLEVAGEDQPVSYACQFEESDYNYLHRRWEDRGLHYRWEHRRDGHTLVLADDTTRARPIDGDPEVRYHSESGSLEDDGIAEWTPVRRIVPARVAASSFDYKNPRPLTAEVPTLNRQGDVLGMEVYEYAGAYGFKDMAEGDALVRRRMEEIESRGKHVEAAGNHRFLAPGRWFRLAGHFDGAPVAGFGAAAQAHAGDDEYLVVEVRHQATNNYLSGVQAGYRNSLTCLRRKIPWRPGPGFNSRQPRIHGPQTAIVVGPKGEEIFTDKYGRIKIQFHWDRSGQYDERSSAWVRVVSAWTGNGYGFVGIPRIGQEVIVNFLDGNPDRPVVTGCLYNERNLPAWGFPAAAHQTGIQSRSTPGGNGFCEMVIHDRAGHELINIHSQKDMVTTVQHNQATVVNGPQQTTDVTTGSKQTTVKQRIKVQSLDSEIVVEAKTKITLKCGASQITLDQEGNITIQGKNIQSIATDDHVVKGSKLNLNPPG